MIESIASNARDAVGDGDGVQGRTIIESKTAYACHAVGDVERSEEDNTVVDGKLK